MKPLISEFSYGYAVTDELIHGLNTPVTAAPIFPSLYQEGQVGGGYDVEIRGPAVPLFIQFKLSHCLTTMNASEAQAGLLYPPYYRMHVRSRRHSNQHQMLIDLQQEGNDVYYCAPGFFRELELNNAYLNQQVCNRSIWIWPSNIGTLPDDESHYVAFSHPQANHFFFCSEPTFVEADISFESVIKRLYGKLTSLDENFSPQESFEQLSRSLENLADKTRLTSLERGKMDRIYELPAIQRTAAIASLLYDSQLYVATLADA